MNFAQELAALMKRDLLTLARQIEAFPSDDLLWQTVPGITNPAGNLILHLEGNLREYIGRQLGGIDYKRVRPEEFSNSGIDRAELLRRVTYLIDVIPAVLQSLSPAQLAESYPQVVLERELSVHGFLAHLYGHLHWHTGQLDYLRRMLAEGGAVQRAAL